MPKEHTATVEVLTAEVRVLMVGSRQITLSVFRQLDEVRLYMMMRSFGRVRDGRHRDGAVDFIGRRHTDGALVRYHHIAMPPGAYATDHERASWWVAEEVKETAPLIVLAGLR